MIPKILHIVWVGPRPMPEEWINSWWNHHPDWQHILWTEENIKGFECQKLIDYCMKIEEYPAVADIVKYEALYRYGGFTTDADSECVAPIDELLKIKEDCFACYQSEIDKPGLISPQIGATKGNKLMRALIDKLKKRDKIQKAWLDTGNLFLTCMIYETKHNIKIYPAHYFIPFMANGAENGKGKIYAIQKWYSTKQLWRR